MKGGLRYRERAVYVRKDSLDLHATASSPIYLDSRAFEAVLFLVVLLLSKLDLYNCLIQDIANHRRRL